MLFERNPTSGFWADPSVAPFRALEALKGFEDYVIVAFDGRWLLSGTIKRPEVEMADFSFLAVKNGIPFNITVSYENGSFGEAVITNLKSELGEMDEEEKLFSRLRLLTDDRLLKLLEEEPDVKDTLKEARGLKLTAMVFDPYFEEISSPAWRVNLSNVWSKGIKTPRELEIVVDAVTSKVLRIAQII